MASRFAIQSLRGSSILRNYLASLLRRQATAIPRLAVVPSRQYSDASRPPPEQRANAIIESLPGNSLISKTGTVVLGTGVAAAAISQELYVVNEETIVLVGTAIMFTLLARILKDPYKEWTEGHINRIRNILNSTRKEHTQAVTARIDAVQQMKDVVDVTKGLFALSKETAKLEHEAFTRQKVAVATEVKAVLDSWVRYEQQEKESEQADLAKAVIERVTKSLTDAKNQQDILNSAIAEVEQLVKSKAI
ncbi:F-type H+-transporting ATPase subunit b [Rhizoctonia solani]|uniref:ATP synthase subunit 4 n=1 Tax=Rhizoctonia solani TaxID=456999 RepID=A0A8H8NQA6_9AGAM|nr:F-type H+-transporting ATPase subunit b [Rhizoctonia solani]QRW16758.1 F-type H+-transporting ATPase subunit b [Rhizoctonia solani]